MRPSLAAIFGSVDSRLPLLAPMTLDAYTSLPLFPGRLATTVVGILAVGALVLSALGLYGVTRLMIVARTRELGLRRALGATSGNLLQLLYADSARFAAVGLVVGLVCALGATRAIAAAITRLRPDPLAVLAACAILLLILAATVGLAARRALRIDPAIALRDG